MIDQINELPEDRRNVAKIHGLVEKLNKLYFFTPY